MDNSEMGIIPHEAEPVILHEGEGRQLVTFAGRQVITVKLGGENSLNRLGIYEVTMAPQQMGASPHFHKELVEIFYVLDGELVLYAKDHKVLAKKGSLVSVPPGTIHAFANPGTAPNRFLLMFTNDENRIKYFEMLAELSKDGTMSDPAKMGEYDLMFDTYRVPDVPFTIERP